MSRFGTDPHAFFDQVYREPAPWDIGAAQPALLQLFDEFPPAGPVLDVGCGTGDLAVALAQAGHDVVGVDFVAAAIDEARARTRALRQEVRHRLRFEVGDALRLSRREQPVGAVVDSGFLHLFDGDVRDRFALELAAVLPPGGRYYLLAFAVTFPIEHGPLQVDQEEITTRFSAERGWRVLACRPAEFQSRMGAVPATAACVERLERPRSSPSSHAATRSLRP